MTSLEDEFSPLRAFTRHDLLWRPVADNSCELRSGRHVLVRMRWLRPHLVAEAWSSEGRWILRLDRARAAITVANPTSGESSFTLRRVDGSAWEACADDETLRLVPVEWKTSAWAITEGNRRMIVSARVQRADGPADIIRIASAAA